MFLQPPLVNNPAVATQLLSRANGRAGEPFSFSFGAECAQCLANVSSALALSGSDTDRVLKLVCLLTDIRDYAAFNEAYLLAFPDQATRPARVCFAVKALPMGARVEIDATAFI